MKARPVETPHETLAGLRRDVAELRASRERLVLAADAERRRLERELHDHVQQHLVALSVNLQLVRDAIAADPDAARALVDEMASCVQEALNEAAQLAQRIYPSLLDAGGLTVALRAAAASAGIVASVEVPADATYPRDAAETIYLCWLGALGRGATRATVAIRADEGHLAFEISCDAAAQKAELDRLGDRVEALGGRLTMRPDVGGMRLSGSLPLAR